MLGGYDIFAVYPPTLGNPFWLSMGYYFERWPPLHLSAGGTQDEEDYFNDMVPLSPNDRSKWLVPIVFFYHIQQREFWEDHLLKYGIDIFQPAMTLSPRLDGLNTIRQPSQTLIEKEVDAIQCTIAFDKYNKAKEASMALTTHHEQLKFARMLAQRRIADELAGDQAANNHNADARHDGDLIVQDINDDGWEDFIRMVKRGRYRLALETHERVSEHIFLNYINRICDRPVAREDFRRFLLLCNKHQKYFRYATINCPNKSK